ncbi:lipopolysaccharide assembly protein LapB [Methylotenera versatilis]|jgi:lipopolysaccharide assembly protein B|uniref:Lipopolysaccharide assembly protein B n=1 Tax=Methylotenera versatilis (strain 301) TaxID=666681 RepID=D7DIW1_METV0|nr:lipopolysaccharide assembly protein LapB [Methylotenera versatilis]ADI29996.1 tetratricopeptide repeat protein [Methylotenera versatilis 301]
MEFEFWWLLALPLFFSLGWLAARVDLKQLLAESTALPAAYFKGLNFLITNQHDKAIEAFSEAVQANTDSLELHFALGSLFRKRGEVDRAIHLHLSLLDKKDLEPQQKLAVTAELAQDYLKAGLLDRAEELFESLDDDRYRQPALRALLEIYVREREWERAIKAATELERLSGVPFRVEVAHYYCEMAVKSKLANDLHTARFELEQALNANKNCVRANVLLGDMEAEADAHKEAISTWRRIEFQQPEYLGLIAPKLLNSYRALNQTADGLALLQTYLQNYKLASLINVLYEATLAEKGPESAAILARTELIKMPSLSVLDQLLQARTIALKQHTNSSENTTFNDIQLMQQTVRHAIGNKTAYHCVQCGFKAKYHHWQCPACNAWEALPAEPTTI